LICFFCRFQVYFASNLVNMKRGQGVDRIWISKICICCAAGSYKLDSTTCAHCPTGGTTLDIATNSAMGCIAEIGHQGPAGGPFQPCPRASYAGSAQQVEYLHISYFIHPS
jgi:hypothetical protein